MRTLTSIASATILALALFSVSPASADVQGGDTFRVSPVAHGLPLNLMNGPARWSGVEVQIPYGSNDLRATGVRQGEWLQISYRASNGFDYTGWVEQRYLAPDTQSDPTAYRLVNVRRGQSVPLLDSNGYNVLAYIPAGAGILAATGPCQNGYCQVRYQCKHGIFEGLVDQSYLAAVQPVYSSLPDPVPVNPSYAGSDAAYADIPPALQDPALQDYAGPVDGLLPVPMPLYHQNPWQHRRHREHHTHY